METNIFACPICKGALEETAQGFRCAPCARAYPIVDGIPDFFVSETEQDSIDLKSQTWLDPEIAAARDTVYRLCARELKGMAFAMQQIGRLSRPGFRILEAGMGTGHFTRWMAEAAAPGARIFAFDFSWPIIARAKANTDGLPGITLLRANARGRLPFREESFDLIFLRLAPLGGHGTPNVEAAFRLLKPGGWLFEAGWAPERYEIPWQNWALQHGFESAETHEWLYPRVQTWEEYSAGIVEHERAAACGIDVAKAPVKADRQQPEQGRSVVSITSEHLHIARKAN